MASPLERREIEIGDALDLYIVERQTAFDVNRARSTLEVRSAEVTGVAVQPDPELGSALRVGELNVHVVAVDRLLQQCGRALRTQPCFDRVVAFAEAFYKTLLLRSIRVRSRRRRGWVLRKLLHFLSQAERPHVRPDLFNVGEAVGFRAGLAGVSPPKRILFVLGPYRVLLFVVDHDLVNRRVFSIRITPPHNLLLLS